MRQSRTIYVGMWKHKLVRDDKKAEEKNEDEAKKRVDEVVLKVQENVMTSREKILARLQVLNSGPRLVWKTSVMA